VTELWPQLPEVVASSLYRDMLDGQDPTPATSHPNQLWAPVGGRAHVKRIQTLIDSMVATAREFGFPAVVRSEARVAFDRAAAPALRDNMNLTWADAGNRGVWSFVSLVALPSVTRWRFGLENPERWIASDLTRHTWARLWWQAVVFDGHAGVLTALSESDLNQLLERRSIGGNPRLVAALAMAVIGASADVPRRDVIRDVTRRLRRYLAFVDVRALSGDQLDELCRALCVESINRLRADAV
jgi:hypothetical protein